jgi:hypothetical protein
MLNAILKDMAGNRSMRLQSMEWRPGQHPTTTLLLSQVSEGQSFLSSPDLIKNALVATLANLFGEPEGHAALRRTSLRVQRIQTGEDCPFVDLPDSTRMRIENGSSSEIAKGLIEEFAVLHLRFPVLLWLRTCEIGGLPQFAELSRPAVEKDRISVELPDLMLADISDPVRLIFCGIGEIGGSFTEARKLPLLLIARHANIPEEMVEFLSAFEDRESLAFRDNFSRLATNSLVWFRTEPNLLVVLSTKSNGKRDDQD